MKSNTFKLGELCDFKYGFSLREQDRLDGDRPVYGSNGVVGYHNQSKVKGPGIIIGRKGSIGKVQVSENDFWPIDTTYYIDEFKKQTDFKWFVYLLKTLNLESLNKAAAVPGLNRNDAYSIIVRCPPYETQKKIAEILDTADRLRQKDKALIEKYNQLTQSLFLEMFGDPVRNEKGWTEVKLGKYLNMIGSGSTPKGGQAVYQREGYIFIRSQNVRNNQVDYSDIYFIDEKIHNQMKRTWVKKDDVLLNITGASIGRAAIFFGEDNSANVNQHVCILRVKRDTLNPVYLLYHLTQNSYQKRIIGSNSGGTREAFNFKQIANFDIVLPSLDLQNKFASMAEEIEKQKQLAEESLKQSEALFNSLLQKAFKGELVV
jgi:type I restriction enzyme, S subunit